MHLKPVEGKILSDAVVKREEPGNEEVLISTRG